jgi:bacterioferritin-associated ferredoxin
VYDPLDPEPVDRCVCYDVTFAELKAIVDQEGLDFDALSARTGCCCGCGTCEQYVRLMLTTGKTRFPVLPSKPKGPPAP